MVCYSGLSAVVYNGDLSAVVHDQWSIRDGIIDSIAHTCMKTREENFVYTDPLLCTINTKHTPSPPHLEHELTQLIIDYELTTSKPEYQTEMTTRRTRYT